MSFKSGFNKPAHPAPKPFDQTRLVEDYGYVSPEKRLEQLILAGHRLRASRADEFDTNDVVTTMSDPLAGEPVPRYKPDLFDAQMLVKRAADRAVARRERIQNQQQRVVKDSPDKLADKALSDASTPPPDAIAKE